MTLLMLTIILLSAKNSALVVQLWFVLILVIHDPFFFVEKYFMFLVPLFLHKINFLIRKIEDSIIIFQILFEIIEKIL